MMDTFNGALTLNQRLLNTMRESPQVVQRGLLVVLLVGLLVGGVSGISTLLGGLNPERQIEQFREEFKQSIELQLRTVPPEQREIFVVLIDNFDAGIEIARSIVNLPTPLPRPLGALARGLGVFVSQPLSYLGNLLTWIIFTHIAAYWLGGRGSIQQMLGLGALSVAPHALDAVAVALAFVPGVGSIIGLAASVWGLVVLVVATSVAHRLETGRAILAVLFFPIVGMILMLLGCCAIFILSLAGGMQ